MSPMAKAMAWTSRVTTISLEMVLPGLAGLWVDQKLGTEPVLLLIGMGLGFTLGIYQLVKLGEAERKKSSRSEEDKN